MEMSYRQVFMGFTKSKSNPSKAQLGAYLPSSLRPYPIVKLSNRVRETVKFDKQSPTRKSLTPRKCKDEETGLLNALDKPVDARLNVTGLSREGKATSPDKSFMYPEMPSSPPQIAWKAKSPKTRKLHIRWLQEIRAMPRHLLDRDFSQTISEFVRMTSMKQRWK